MKIKSHNVTLSESVSAIVESQVASGRFKDFSAAIQEAAFNYFVGTGSPFEEYGVTPAEVDAAYDREIAAIEGERKQGKLKA